jgi:hypothetical protein
MSEPRYMLMLLADSTPTGERFWAAAKVQDRGRALTRAEAEALAAQITREPRFLMQVTEESERFTRDQGAPTLATMNGETIWDYGEPTRVDMLSVLRDSAFSENADGAEWPDADKLPVSVAAVVEEAFGRFGSAEAHRVETVFDALIMDLGGKRHGDPPFYDVPLAALGVG